MLNYSTSLNALDNKTILITGAGDGIGKSAALAFSKHGATVILLGRTVKKLESVYDQIVDAGYPEPAIVPLDMKGATQTHYQAMANTIVDQFGKLDGVLHNAGILGHLEPFKQITEDMFNEVMQVNLNSQFLMTQALLAALELAPKASVVFTTSSVGSQGRAFWGTYCISKFATEGMMQLLAAEYQNSSFRFNCINPGGTRTGMRAKAFPAEDPKTLKTADDIMPLYLYLMSDDSQHESGRTFAAQPK